MEINGQRYDAATGRLVGAVRQISKTVMPGNGRVMDGFMRRPAAPVSVEKTAAPKPRATARRVVSTTRRQPQPAKTLMRSFVVKPKHKLQDIKDKQYLPKRSNVINSARAFRAKTVTRNAHISHFIGRQKDNSGVEAGEIVTPRVNAQSQSMALARPNPTLATISGSQLERLLDQALFRADAHRQAIRDRASGRLKFINRLPRWLTAVIALVLIVAAGGFAAWQKVPQLSLHVAASRAHVNALLPGYIPYGYNLVSPVNFGNGAVNIKLQSTANSSQSVDITEQATNQDSQSIISNTIPSSAPIQTTQVNGTPVYIYGKGCNALFKKDKLLVKISDKCQLPADQKTDIAKSLLNQQSN